MAERAHGTRACYVFGPDPGGDRSRGCRCEPCREANRAYARARDRATRRPDEEVLPAWIDADPVRVHILAMSAAGVGYKRVAELAGVGKTSLLDIRNGRRTRCTRALAAAVLAVAVDPGVAADGVHVDARSTWRLIGRILRQPGWTKRRISAEIGQGGRALQLGRRQVTARNSRAIAEMAERFGLVRPPVNDRRFPLQPLLVRRSVGELADASGYHRKQVHRWAVYGVPATVADQVAVSVGLHPSNVWPDWYELEEAS